MADDSPSTNDNPPISNTLTTLHIKVGTSVDALNSRDPVDLNDDVKTATQLRNILVSKGTMSEGDQFLAKDDSPLNKDLEGSTQWSELVAEEVF
jgi:hypothetical protein